MNIKDLPNGSYTPVTTGSQPLNIKNLPQDSYTPVEATPQVAPEPKVSTLGGFNPASQAKKALPILGGTAKAIGSGIINAEVAVGKDITAGKRAASESKNEQYLRDQQFQAEKVIADEIKKNKDAGKDTSHLEKVYAGVRANSVAPKDGDFAEAVPESQKTNMQGLGDVAGVALDALTAGTYGKGAAQTGKLLRAAPTVVNNASKAAKGFGVAKNVAKGAGIGYAYDVDSAVRDGEEGGRIYTPNVGTAVGAGIPILGAAVGSIARKLKPNEAADLTKIIDQTRDAVDTKKKVTASIKGGQRTEGGVLEKRAIEHSADDEARAFAVKDYLDPKANHDTNIANANAGITTIYNTKQLPLLKENPNNLHWNEVNAYVQKNAKDSKRVMQLFDGKAIINNEDIAQARQKLDATINFERKNTLPMSPERATVNERAIQDRNTLNKLLEENVATGGNIEGLNKTQDFVAASKERGIPVDEAAIEEIEKQFGVVRNPEAIQRAIQIRQNNSQMTHLFDAINNLAENSRKQTGTNGLGRFVKNNPVKAGLAKKILGKIGTGAAVGVGAALGAGALKD